MIDTSALEREPESRGPTTGAATGSPLGRRALLSRPWAIPAALLATSAVVAGCDLSDSPFDRRLHLLRRMTYGPTTTERDRIETMGETAWLAEQLDPGSLDTSALDALLVQLPALAKPPLQLAADYPDVQTATAAGAQLKLAWLIRAVHSPAQVLERMVEFWSDHFNVPQEGRFLQLAKIVEDRDTIRAHALGRFDDLLVASAKSVAMLYYLDNAQSTAGAINENYARELLELHTLGVDGGYTEADVVNTARLLTGWGYGPSGGFEFHVAEHDPAPVTILGWVRPGGNDHLAHGEAFLRWLASHPSTVVHVCRKLAVRFVGDQPDEGIVDAMAAAWLAHDSQIAPVIEAMVSHPGFDAVAGSKFRRPLDYLAAVLRALEADVVPTTDVALLAPLGQSLASLGQLPFDWPAPNGYPDVEGAWLNAGGLLNRWTLIGALVATPNPLVQFDNSAIGARFSGLTADEVYDRASQMIVGESVTGAGTILLASQTGWDAAQIPTGAELAAGLPVVLFAFLTSTDAMYR